MLAARRETLNIYNELRALAWAGVMLIAAGTGIIVKNHLHDLGPLTIAIALGAAAIGCYAWASLKEKAALDEYVVLLGALLISADVAFIEHQWHLLDAEWQRHLLLLALVHGVAAYAFRSRAVLSLSIAALTAWMGVERRPTNEIDAAIRAFEAAGVLAAWRLVNRREEFHGVLEHVAANLAFWGALILTLNRDTRWTGASIAVPMAVAAVVYGFRTRRELFVIYGYVYGLIAIDILFFDLVNDEKLDVLFLLVSTVTVIVAMIVTHLRLRK